MTRILLLAACALLGIGGVAHAQPCAGGHFTLCQAFDSPWPDGLSPDGLWRINGPWPGTGNMLEPTLARLLPGDDGEGELLLSVAPDVARGSEIQTLAKPGYSYGYYETDMKVTPVPGVCASFFWIEAPQYGPHEWDIEFLTEDFAGSTGAVRFTVHPSNTSFKFPLPFNPSQSFHRYGFLWTPGRIVFTVDGKPAHTVERAELNTTARGFIMANALTALPHWCNGPPKQETTTSYHWIRFTADAATASK